MLGCGGEVWRSVRGGAGKWVGVWDEGRCGKWSVEKCRERRVKVCWGSPCLPHTCPHLFLLPHTPTHFPTPSYLSPHLPSPLPPPTHFSTTSPTSSNTFPTLTYSSLTLLKNCLHLWTWLQGAFSVNNSA